MVSNLVGLAMCPSCHTQDLSMTNLAVSAGAGWECSRCGSRWDAVRLATIAAYAAWMSGDAATAVNPTTPARGDA